MAENKKSIDRAKELAIIKAQNEMLENTKNDIIKRDGEIDETVLKQIDDAIDENLQKARITYNATPEEVSNAKYHGASVAEVKKYQKRLQMKGITDEQLRQKSIATADVATSSSSKKDDEEQIKKFTQNERNIRGVGKADDNETIEDIEEEDNGKFKKLKKKLKREKTKKAVEPSKDNAKLDESNITTAKEASSMMKNVADVDDSKYEFNAGDIPSYIQYDIIPLPSKGECYKHKKSKVAVAYLTAADENIIASPNIYRDGNLLDVILERKILDKSFKVKELVEGDRDAILIWLRATSYGVDFPITATHPQTRKRYDIIPKLDTFKYKDFDLKSDENGLFTFETSNGDIIKYRFLTANEKDDLKNSILSDIINVEDANVLKYTRNLIESVSRSSLEEESKQEINETLKSIADVMSDVDSNYETEALYYNSITKQMIYHIVSINGNEDKEYIEQYIEYMKASDAFKFRNIVTEGEPGVDMKITVNVPESDGGGSFDTFLNIDDSFFLNF